MKCIKYDNFNVYVDNSKNVFKHVRFESPKDLYSELFEYFFSLNKLIRYCEIENVEENCLDRTQLISLYNNLQKFIDKENYSFLKEEVSNFSDIIDILFDENIFIKDGDKINVKKDKCGKIGELIFFNILSDYFRYKHVINKFHLITSYEQSVFGMDEIFYSEQENMLIFGESKLTKNLSNGIGLVNKSLSLYEERLKDEFKLVLRNDFYFNKLNIPENLKKAVLNSKDFEQFIDVFNIDKICIPIFIMHGKNMDEKKIIENLNNIKCNSFFGLTVKYILVSLPIIDKENLMSYFATRIAERIEYYGNKV